MPPLARGAGRRRLACTATGAWGTASAPGSVERRVQLLHTIAELCETQLNDVGRAVNTYARALAEDPSSEATQAELERVALLANDATNLVETYERQVQEVQDPSVAAVLHVKAAQIRENMLGDTRGAIAHYTRVLALDLSRVPDIEYSALQALMEAEKRTTERGTVVWLVGLNPSVLEVVRKAGFDQRLGRERLMFNARMAIERYQALQARG